MLFFILSDICRAIEFLIPACVEFEKVNLLIPLLQPLVALIRNYIKQKNTGALTTCFTLFNDIACVRTDDQNYTSCIPRMTKFILEICGHKQIDRYIRQQASQFLGWVVKYNPAVIQKSNLVRPILNTTYSFLSAKPQNNEYDDESETLYNSGTSILDELCCRIPSQFIFQGMVSDCVKMVNSQNQLYKLCGVTVLGVMSEGCSERTRDNLGKLVPLMIKEYNNQIPKIRETCVMSLINYSEFCQPLIQKFHKSVMGLVLKTLNDPSDKIRQRGCLLIDTFCEQIGDILIPYADGLLKKLVSLLNYYMGHKNQDSELIRDLKLNIVSAIGTISENLGRDYAKYFKSTIELLKKILEHCGRPGRKNDPNIVLRGQVTECIGIVARSVGKETFNPKYMNYFMNMMISQVKSFDDNELREYSLNFLSNVATCYGESFSNYLDISVKFIFGVLNSADIKLIPKEELTGGAFLENCPVNTPVHMDSVDLSGFEMNIEGSVMDEKCAAVNCLGMIAHNTKGRFMKHLGPTIDYLMKHLYFFASVKIQRKVALALQKVTCAVVPPYPFPRNMNNDTIRKMKNMFDRVMDLYLNRIEDETDKETVACICDGIADILQHVGPFALKGHAEKVASILLLLLGKDAECFQLDEPEFDKVDDHDPVLFPSVLNCVDWVCKTMGAGFEPYWKDMYPLLLPYLKDRKNVSDKIAVTGTFAECTLGLKGNMTQYAKHFYPYITSYCKKETNHHLKRNAVFCLGAMAQYCPRVVGNDIKKIMGLLNSLLNNVPPSQEDFVTDNACGCLSRVMVAFHKQIGQMGSGAMGQCFQLLLKNSPLKNDHEEDEIVFDCFGYFLQKGHPLLIKNHFLMVLSVFARNLAHRKVAPKVKKKIVGIMNMLKQKMGKNLQEAMRKMNSDQERSILMKCFGQGNNNSQ